MKARDIKRARSKEIHKRVKKMSPTELMKFLDTIVINHSDNVVSEMLEVLHEEYRFGPKRQQNVIDKLQEKQKL